MGKESGGTCTLPPPNSLETPCPAWLSHGHHPFPGPCHGPPHSAWASGQRHQHAARTPHLPKLLPQGLHSGCPFFKGLRCPLAAGLGSRAWYPGAGFQAGLARPDLTPSSLVLGWGSVGWGPLKKSHLPCSQGIGWPLKGDVCIFKKLKSQSKFNRRVSLYCERRETLSGSPISGFLCL